AGDYSRTPRKKPATGLREQHAGNRAKNFLTNVNAHQAFEQREHQAEKIRIKWRLIKNAFAFREPIARRDVHSPVGVHFSVADQQRKKWRALNLPEMDKAHREREEKNDQRSSTQTFA